MEKECAAETGSQQRIARFRNRVGQAERSVRNQGSVWGRGSRCSRRRTDEESSHESSQERFRHDGRTGGGSQGGQHG